MQQLEMGFQGLRSQHSQDIVLMQAQIPEHQEDKLNLLSLGQAFQSCHPTMVSSLSLAALHDTWSKVVGHLSAQLKSLHVALEQIPHPRG